MNMYDLYNYKSMCVVEGGCILLKRMSDNENVVEMIIQHWIYFMPLNCTLKIGKNSKIYVTYIFFKFFKK